MTKIKTEFIGGKDRINLEDVYKECYPRKDPNTIYVQSMFMHRVFWYEPSYKSDPHTGRSTGEIDYDRKYNWEYGRIDICCLTGCRCDYYNEKVRGASLSHSCESDCNMCHVPDRMPAQVLELTRIIMERNAKDSKKRK